MYKYIGNTINRLNNNYSKNHDEEADEHAMPTTEKNYEVTYRDLLNCIFESIKLAINILYIVSYVFNVLRRYWYDLKITNNAAIKENFCSKLNYSISLY